MIELINDKCVVAVCMLAYNHEVFIAQAIEGVVLQKTNFKVKLIIGEDCSTDKTRSICESYAIKYPELIELLPVEKNLGMSKNFKRTLVACKGVYTAVCEGDDYWTDEYKLQKQVDFLNNNPDFILCYHKVEILDTNNVLHPDFLETNYNKSETNVYDLIAIGNYMHTCSVMFRNISDYFPEDTYDNILNDYFLWVWLVQFGKIKKLNDLMAVYRNGVGVFASQSTAKQVLFSQETRKNLVKALKDPALIRILELRLDNYRMQTLPHSLRTNKNLEGIYSKSVLATKASTSNLLQALLLKLRNLF